MASRQSLRKDLDATVLTADKDYCTVILNKCDYLKKANDIIEEGVTQGKYVETTDST